MRQDEKDIILIVDDIDINRIILQEILQDDYGILEAADGSEALDILFSNDALPTAIRIRKVIGVPKKDELLRARQAVEDGRSWRRK